MVTGADEAPPLVPKAMAVPPGELLVTPAPLEPLLEPLAFEDESRDVAVGVAGGPFGGRHWDKRDARRRAVTARTP
jgi:hypothetical protein